MSADIQFDAVVVGAGVVGLACARALAARGDTVLVVERHARFGIETSSRNSEVVHAGIYYPTGSLKARLCVRGRDTLYAWCAVHDVPHRRLGKLIVATTPDEEPKLQDIQTRAAANGVHTLEELTPAQVRRLEPRVRATAALWSPESGIVDSHRLMQSLLDDAEAHGATVAWRHALTAAERRPSGYHLVLVSEGQESQVRARDVVNAAGLEADRVAALPGLDPVASRYEIRYAKGHYLRVHPRAAQGITHLVYPTPVSAGLGIHVTLDLAGGVRLGPDVHWLASRTQDYHVPETLRASFHAAVSRYLDGLTPEDLAPDLAGIRPKLQRPGEAFADFVIAEEGPRGLPGWVNLVGVESPGLTCALAIGDMVRDLVPHN